MPLIDSHAHPLRVWKSGQLAAWINRAQAAGVESVIAIGTQLEDWSVYRDLSQTSPHFFRHTVGLHPCYVDESWEDAVTALAPYFADRTRPVALGEIGLDYFHLPKDPQAAQQLQQWQQEAFKRQLNLAYQLQVPVVIHSRNAFADCVQLIDQSGVAWSQVVFHCFVEGPAEIQQVLARGGRGSFTGIITYPKAEAVRLALQAQGIERLMLETDSPYLSPQSVRSAENEPSHLPEIAQKAADLLGVSLAELTQRTSENTKAFYGW